MLGGMFVPSDPRFDEVLRLSALAVGPGLNDPQRARWRELCAGMLGTLQAAGQQAPERRRVLRAVASLHVDVLSPAALAGPMQTSSVSAGGLSMPVPGPIPRGTIVELSISVRERSQPIKAKGSVVWCADGHTGLAFIDLVQNDRELLEAIAVRSLLVYTALE
jgi:PilZ domain